MLRQSRCWISSYHRDILPACESYAGIYAMCASLQYENQFKQWDKQECQSWFSWTQHYAWTNNLVKVAVPSDTEIKSYVCEDPVTTSSSDWIYIIHSERKKHSAHLVERWEEQWAGPLEKLEEGLPSSYNDKSPERSMGLDSENYSEWMFQQIVIFLSIHHNSQELETCW